MDFLYVGTYTEGSDSEGIYVFLINAETGCLTLQSSCETCDNPSFLTSNGSYLYAANERLEDGYISAYQMQEATGALLFLNRCYIPGAGMCHLSIGTQTIYASNYISGNIAACSVLPNGHLGQMVGNYQHKGSSVNPVRQEQPHVHSTTISPDGRCLIAADLGMDQLITYPIDSETGALKPSMEPVHTESGEGPRHFTFHPDRPFAYLITELGNHLIVYHSTANKLHEIECHTLLPADFQGENLGADLHISPDGAFIYASNRGNDQIVAFRINNQNGKLSHPRHYFSHGKWPRNFCISPDGHFMVIANQNSGTVVVCPINRKTGDLQAPVWTAYIPQAVCVLWKNF